MKSATLVASFLLAALGVLGAANARAHPFAPSLLELREHANGRASLIFRTPIVRAQGAPLVPVLPAGCRESSPARFERDALAQTRVSALDCGPEPLAGRTLGIEGLRASATNALVRVELEDGTVARAVIDADRPLFVVPARAEPIDTIRSYLELGLWHILGGLDHLLFVAGLVLLVRSRRTLIATVTSFTAGHALTLCASALGFVQLPAGPIEVAIAASVFWLAVELASGRPRRLRPAPVAAAFGLLHGFGFAAALREAGLPASDVPLALASFNVGIELGQLAFVAVLLLFVRSLRAFERPLAYAFGSLAGFWLIERVWLALGLS